jgi:hypothetical protein
VYTIHADDKLLFDSLSEDQASIVLSPKLSLDVNKPGSLSFVIPPTNALHGKLQKLKTLVVVKQDSTILFRGRVMEIETDLYNQQTVYCEGEKAFLLDSLHDPYFYSGTVHGLFRKLIENHNAMVDEEKQFTIGTIAAVGESETTEVESENCSSTSSEIDERLLNAYGGYLRTRTVGNIHYIDWVKTYGELNTQPIEFSVNMLDLTDKVDAGDVFTCLIPIGASVIDDEGEYTDPVSIASVNNGLNYIQDDEAVAKYGKIWRTKTWSYEEDPAKLLEKAREYLKTGIALETITLKAIDLHFTSGSVSAIRIGHKVRILSNPHGIDKEMLCSQLEIDLLNPENTVYTFGERPRTLSENIVQAEEDLDGLTGRGGGGGVRKQIGEVKTWAQLTVDAQKAHINMIAWDINDLTNRQSQAEIDIDGMAAAITLKADRSIVNDVERRVSSAEIAIDAANSKINLLTNNEEVNNLHDRVSEVEIGLDAANAKIDLLTNDEEITDLVKRVSSAETAIDAANARIDQKASSDVVEQIVERVDDCEDRIVDTEHRVGNAEVAIDAANARIDLKADQTITNSLSERMTNAEIDIDAANSRIDQKADLTITTSLAKRVNQAEIDINAAEAAIALKADSTLVDQYGKRLTSAELNIDGLNSAIELKASKEIVDELGNKLTDTDAQLKVQAGLIAAKVSNSDFQSALRLKADSTALTNLSNSVDNRFDEQGDLIAGHGTQIKANADAIALRAVKKDVDTQFSVQAGQIAAKASQSDFNKLGDRVSSAESTITQHANQIQSKVSQTAFNALGERVATAESSITQQANRISAFASTLDSFGNRINSAELILNGSSGEAGLISRVEDAESSILAQGRQISLKADKIDLDGYVTAERFDSDFATFRSSLTQAITSTSGFFTNVSTVNLELGGSATAWRNVTLGDKTGAFLSRSGQGTLDLSHSHKVIVNDDGTVTLGEVSSSGGSFRIADTKAYKEAVSAAQSNVTLSQTGWTGSINTVSASNGKQITVMLPSFTTSVDSWNSLHKTYARFYSTNANGSAHFQKYVEVDASAVFVAGKNAGLTEARGNYTTGYNDGKADWNPTDLVRYGYSTTAKMIFVRATNAAGVPVIGGPIDASEIYNAGAEGVTLSQSGWLRAQNTVTASNGETETVNLPPMSFEESDWTGADPYKMIRVTITEADGSKNLIRSHIVNSGGLLDTVTLSQSGWTGSVNTVNASNGKQISVMLPAFTTSVDEWNSLHKTYARFYSTNADGSAQFQRYVEVDASSVYDAGKDEHLPTSITRTGYSTSDKTVTVKAANSYKDLLTGVTIDASEIYSKGQTDWQPEKLSRTGYNTTNKTVTVRALNAAGVPVLGGQMIDASEIYNAGYSAGEDSGGGYDEGYAQGRIDWQPDSLTRTDYSIVNNTVTVRAMNAAGVPVIGGTIDAKEIYQNGFNKGNANGYDTGYAAGTEAYKPTDITRTSYSTSGKTVTVKASNSQQDLLTGVTIDAGEIYAQGRTDWQPDSLTRTSYSTSNKTVSVRASNAAGVPVIGGDIDASEIWQDGYDTGSSGSYDAGYEAGRAAGYSAGYNEGHRLGYGDGYEDGAVAGWENGWSEAEDHVTLHYDFDAQRLSTYRVQITGSIWAEMAGKVVATAGINRTMSV